MDAKSAKESKKTFVLQQEAALRVDADLLVGPAATITRVHLVSATFADGSVWRAPSDGCVQRRAEPVYASWKRRSRRQRHEPDS